MLPDIRYCEILTVCRCLPVDILHWNWCKTCSARRRWVQCAENKPSQMTKLTFTQQKSLPPSLSHGLSASAQKTHWGRSSTNFISNPNLSRRSKTAYRHHMCWPKKWPDGEVKWWRETLISQNMPARGGFSPSRSFSAAFSLSSLCKRLLLRREAVKKCEKVKILKNAKMSPSCTLTVTESARPKACLITILCWEASLVLTCFGVVLVLTCFDVILVSICFSVILVLTFLKIGL